MPAEILMTFTIGTRDPPSWWFFFFDSTSISCMLLLPGDAVIHLVPWLSGNRLCIVRAVGHPVTILTGEYLLSPNPSSTFRWQFLKNTPLPSLESVVWDVAPPTGWQLANRNSAIIRWGGYIYDRRVSCVTWASGAYQLQLTMMLICYK